MTTPPKFIYFDVGNVFHTFANLFGTVARDFGRQPQDFVDVFTKYKTDITTGKIDVAQFWNLCVSELHIKGGESYNFARSWVSDYLPIEPMHQLAKALVGKYQLGILSNHYFGNYPESISQQKIPDIYYDAIVISAEVGCQKPDPKIYDIAEESACFSGQDILFIDDSQVNLDQAIQHHWQTFLFNPLLPEESVATLTRILL